MSSDSNSAQSESPSAPVVMVVEDDNLIRKMVGRKLQAAGYEVILIPTAADALIVAQRMEFHVLVLDLSLVDVDPFAGIHDGFSLLDWLERQMGDFKFRIVIYTSQGNQRLIEKAEAKGVFAFCIKRRDMSNLVQCVDEAAKSLKAA